MIPLSYNLRNLRVRVRTTLMTALAFALVASALVVLLAFVNGVQRVCRVTGQPENVLALQKGAQEEILSELDKETIAIMERNAHVLRNGTGHPMASPELFLVVNYRAAGKDHYDFRQLRGVLPMALEVHTQIRIVRGHMFQPHQYELIVGTRAALQQGIELGAVLEIGPRQWRVVGLFEADGAVFESEFWCDLHQLARTFRRPELCSTVVLRTAGSAQASQLAAELNDSRRISVSAERERFYYQRQAKYLLTLRAGAFVVAGLMGLGAMFAIGNTMLASIAQRVKDIAMLRVLGFPARDILVCFVLESLLIAAAGGAMGTLLACAVDGLGVSTPLSGKELAFGFQVDGPIVAVAAGFTLALGLLGGVVPAWVAVCRKPRRSLH